MRTAVVYTRISRDPTGQQAGVTRQEDDCRKLAQEHGWEVGTVFSDNDTSAYSGTPRPGYRAMLEAIRAGRVDVVVVWHVDRLYRRVSDLEEYISACQPANVPTYAVQSGPLDLTTPSGRMVARQLGAVAQYESEQKGERQRRANMQRAQQGKHFGTRRPFGYELDGITIRPDEAKAVRDACRWILDGVNLSEAARRWNRAGLRTPQAGNEWTGTVLRNTITTPRIAGIRTYRKEIVRGEDGEPIATEWPGIIDRDTWRAVQAKLNDPGKQSWPADPDHRLLLSGVARCDECDAFIQSGGTRNGKHRYRCSNMGGHVYRQAAPVDEFVEAAAVARLRQPDALDAFAGKEPGDDPATIRAGLAELQQRQDSMAEAFADGAVTLAQLKAANRRAEGRRAELETRLPTYGSPTLAELVRSSNVAAAWQELDIATRRLIVGLLMEVRLTAPGTKENAYLDWRAGIVNPETVRIRFKDGTEEPGGAAKKRTVKGQR